MATTLSAGPGEIRPDTLYTLAEFQRIVGWGRFALRTARKRRVLGGNWQERFLTTIVADQQFRVAAIKAFRGQR